MLQIIDPALLIPANWFMDRGYPLAVDLVYAKGDHPRNIFDTYIYKPDAKLWLHHSLAAVVICAAQKLYDQKGWSLVLKDCLRTVEAQARMMDTPIVRANPRWLEEPNRMLSPPGRGAHPRAMAIDIGVLDANGIELDMGTEFDDMGAESARSYTALPPDILERRSIIEQIFVQSGAALGSDILPLPNEWWDFRFYPDFTAQFAPLSCLDLPAQMQMTPQNQAFFPDFGQEHFDRLGQDILNRVHDNL